MISHHCSPRQELFARPFLEFLLKPTPRFASTVSMKLVSQDSLYCGNYSKYGKHLTQMTSIFIWIIMMIINIIIIIIIKASFDKRQIDDDVDNEVENFDDDDVDCIEVEQQIWIESIWMGDKAFASIASIGHGPHSQCSLLLSSAAPRVLQPPFCLQ